MKVLSIPAEHPYTQAVRPASVAYLPDPDIDGNWWPHPALTAEYWRETDWGRVDPALRPDVVHVHFGFEHFSPAEIREFAQALPVPLVVTVHDVENPHLAEPAAQAEHRERLQILLDAADAVLTLTECAAAEVRERFGVADAVVVPHPQIADPVVAEREPRAAVFIKSLRSNVVADAEFYRAIAREVPLDVYVHDVAATARLRAQLNDAALNPNLALHVHAPMGDRELHAAVARATACVLPYTRGTHSGWLEMCRDQGTNVAAPDVGCYAGQADTAEAVATYRAGDGAAAGRAARELVERGAVPLAVDRRAQLAQVKRVHENIYMRLAGSERGGSR